MAAVTQRVNNYLGGVSRQPDDRKKPGQVREALNAYPDPTFGLIKRPGFKFLTTLKDGGGDGKGTDGTAFTGTSLDNAHWFYIHRDGDEKYVGCVLGHANTPTSAAIHIWNANPDGNGDYQKCQVTTPSTGGVDPRAYLTGILSNNYHVLTVQDTTIITNKLKTVAAKALTTHTSNARATIRIHSVEYSASNDVRIDAGSGVSQVPAGYDTVATIGTITGGTGYAVGAVGTSVATTSAGSGTGLTVRVTSISGGGATGPITGLAIVDPGREYAASEVITISGGDGNATVPVASINATGAAPTYTTRNDDAFQSGETNTKLSASEILSTLKSRIEKWVSKTGSVNMDVVQTTSSLELHRHDGSGNKNDVALTNVIVRGGIDGTKLSVFRETVDSTAGLPAESVHGRLAEIKNTSANADTYWAKFIADNGVSGTGYWEEAIAGKNADGTNVSPGLDAATMPHELYNNATNEFIFRQVSWTDRLVGDDTTNEHPSFVGKKIEQGFFYNNRLGFLTEDNVSMSRAGEFFNMYHVTAQTSTDADPIDISCSSVRPAKLHGIVPTPQGLILFSQNQQFMMFADDGNMTPANAIINGLSNYEMDIEIDPVEVGHSITFVSKTPAYTRIFSMISRGLAEAPVVVDIGKVVSDYIPSTINYLISSPQNSFVGLYGKASSTVFFYRTYNDGQKDLLQSWFKWQLPGNAINVVVDSDVMFAVVKTASTYELISSNLTSTPEETILVNNDGETINPYVDLYATAKSVSQYPIEKLNITTAGAGYGSAPNVTIAAPASGTQATADATISGGAVTALTITNAGKGYDWANPPAVSFSGGSPSQAAVATATVYNGSYCELPYTDIATLDPVLLISGSGTDNFSGISESGFSITPSRTTISSTSYYAVPQRDLSGSTASKVVVGYSFVYDIELPRTYFQLSPDGSTTDFTAALTIARMKFSVGLSSVIGFKLQPKGFRGASKEFTGDGSTTEFTVPFSYDDTNDVSVTQNGTKISAYTIDDAGKITFSQAPASGDKIVIYIDKWFDVQSVVKADEYVADDVSLDKHTLFTIPIHQRTENFVLRVYSDSPFPVSLTSMMWEGNYSPRYYRRN